MSTDTHLSTGALKLSSWAAALAVIAGVMVLVGWTFDIAVLKSILPGWISMKANTAICFILSGIALWLTARPPATTNPQHPILFLRLAQFCSLLVGLVGLLTLGEYIFGWNLGIDQWLFLEPVGTVGTPHPGRMTEETALLFVLLSTALWTTVGSSQKLGIVLASKILGIMVTTLAVGEILSYFTPGLGPYVWFGFPIMSMHAATLFAVLGMSVIAINWQRGLPWSLGSGTTAAFACGMAALVFVGLSINRSQFWLGETNRRITSSEEVLNDIVKIQINLTEAQAHTRGYAITGDIRFMDHYFEDISDYRTKMDELRLRIAGNPQQQQQLSLIETNAGLLQRWTQQFIDTPQTGTTRRKMDARGDEFMNSIHVTVEQIESEHRQIIRELKQNSANVTWFSYLAIITGTFVSLLIFLAVIFRLNSVVNTRKQTEDTLSASEEKFSSIFESSPAMVAIGTLNGTMVDVNLSYTNFLGFHRKEMLGKSLADLGVISAAELQRLLELGQRVGESLRDVEVTLRARGGKLLNALLSAEIVTMGGIPHRLATLQDITARKQAEAALREKELLLSESQRIAHIGSWRFELTGQLIWSDETYRIYGVSPDTFTPTVESLLNLIHPDDRAAMQAWIGDCLAGKKPDALEFRITMPDGKARILNGFGELQYDDSNNPTHLTGIVHDITKRKQAEIKLTEQMEELRRWHDVTSGREGRILDLKHEMNELLGKSGLPPRYPSAELPNAE